MHICTLVYAYVCVRVHMYVEARGQPWLLFLKFHPPCLSMAWNVLIRVGWLVSKAQRSVNLYFPSVGITITTRTPSFKNLGSGNQNLVLVLAMQAFYYLSPLLSI